MSVPIDQAREDRIGLGPIADAYGPDEQAMGWYYYLEEELRFPFTARCCVQVVTSPLRIGDEVSAVGLAPEGECEHSMFVLITWDGDTLAVPLHQLDLIDVDDRVRQAAGDWRYWIDRGYEF